MGKGGELGPRTPFPNPFSRTNLLPLKAASAAEQVVRVLYCPALRALITHMQVRLLINRLLDYSRTSFVQIEYGPDQSADRADRHPYYHDIDDCIVR